MFSLLIVGAREPEHINLALWSEAYTPSINSHHDDRKYYEYTFRYKHVASCYSVYYTCTRSISGYTLILSREFYTLITMSNQEPNGPVG